MDFWQVHGVLGGLVLCFFCAFLPRLTLAFLTVISGASGITFLGVIGWIFAPRLVIAIIATTLYWKTNPVLCILAWIVMFCGESTEKSACVDKLTGH